MKLFFLCSLLTSLGCNAASNGSKKTLPVSKLEEAVKAEAAKAKTAEKKEEDCDDKAKKPVEIKEESISLSGNTGCSLDEAKSGL